MNLMLKVHSVLALVFVERAEAAIASFEQRNRTPTKTQCK